MGAVFPAFHPFTEGLRFGFEGRLRGPASGQIYRITLEADHATYPQMPPRVRISPPVGKNWIGEGKNRRLCMERDWRPARSTFANTLLAVLRYLDEFDPGPRPALQSAAEEGRGWNNRWTALPWWRGTPF